MSETRPELNDAKLLSSRSVEWEVLKETLQKPLTVFPMSFGILGALAMATIDPIFFLLLLGGLGLGTGTFVINYFFRSDVFAQKYLSRVYAELDIRRQRAREGLERDLAECAKFGGELGRRGQDQLPELTEKFKNFRYILSQKLNEGELTFARFLGAGEQVYLGTIDNLRDVINILKSIKAIGTEYQEQLARLEKVKRPSDVEQRELTALRERKELGDRQAANIRQILALNEEALTKIDLMAANLAGTRTARGEASVDLESALAELQELADRVHQYSVSEK